MGGAEDDEPPSKRVKISSGEVKTLSKDLSLAGPVGSLGDLMARSLPSQGDETVGSNGVIKRVEFVRIITKALYSLGYERSGALLEEESGIPLHSSIVNLFRKHVLDGNWDESVTALRRIGRLEENIMKSASFLILEQKFFELLGQGSFMEALETLRTEIAPLCVNMKRVHELSSCIVSPSRCILLGFANQGNLSTNPRMKLLEELQKLLPPTIMIPERRLEHLVEQALNVQRESCVFHNSPDNLLSLYTDHQCGRDHIPTRTLQVLQAHRDEVWFLQFSNNGKYLASSSSDCSAIIWEVNVDGGVSLKHTLMGHQNPVLAVAWSPDSRQLLTCGVEEVVRRWDARSGECLHVYEKTGVNLVSCGWLPDGNEIFSGMTDKSIQMWDLDGKELECWKGQRTLKISDMAITSDGKHIISMCRENAILLHDWEAKTERFIEEDKSITSFSLSRDNKFVLVNVTSQEIHLWNIVDEPKLIAKYRGHKRTRLVIRSCFGGSEQTFIASGSEDSQKKTSLAMKFLRTRFVTVMASDYLDLWISEAFNPSQDLKYFYFEANKVYIWHRGTGELLERLPGHSGAVNCVSWNPANPHMFASASDDRTIRIWGLNKVSPKRKDPFSSNGYIHHCNGGIKQ